MNPLQSRPSTADEAPTGNCFENTACAILDGQFGEHVVLCHGQPVLDRPGHSQHGQRFEHAWLELRGVALDLTAPPTIAMPVAEYYERGGIRTEDVRRYTPQEARRAMLEYGTYGPWVAPFVPTPAKAGVKTAEVTSTETRGRPQRRRKLL